jgi:hypothetical protein
VARERANELQQRGQVVLEEQRARLEAAVDAGKQAAQRSREELSSEQRGDAPSPGVQ